MQTDPQSLLLDRRHPAGVPNTTARQLASHEIDILRKAATGDPIAVGSVFDGWSGHLYNFTDALRIPESAADEIVEEVLRRLIFEGPRLANRPEQIGGWMLDTAKACAGAVVKRLNSATRSTPAQSKIAQDFSALLASGGVNEALRYLNALTPFRFTAVYRIDGLSITNLILFDRETGFDADGTAGRLSDTFCVWVHEALSVVQLEDSLTDPRAIGHPKRNIVRSYCGGPVRNSDGLLVGTLCHFDYEPHLNTMREVDVLAEVGSLLAPVIGS